MGRCRSRIALSVHMNGRRVGTLLQDGDGATSFAYHPEWLEWEHTFPISLSLRWVKGA